MFGKTGAVAPGLADSVQLGVGAGCCGVGVGAGVGVVVGVGVGAGAGEVCWAIATDPRPSIAAAVMDVSSRRGEAFMMFSRWVALNVAGWHDRKSRPRGT